MKKGAALCLAKLEDLAMVPIWDYHQQMRVIAISTLKAFWEQPEYKDSEEPLRSWLEEAQVARWTRPADIKVQYGNASILQNRRVVFNIKGNDYRLIVAVAYRFQAIYVKFIGTHAQYDAIDAQTVEVQS